MGCNKIQPAIRTATQLCYSETTINKIKNATTESEITRILRTAREEELQCKRQSYFVHITEQRL